MKSVLANPMFFVGVIENKVDPRLEGRVQVRAFGVHGLNTEVPTEALPWAQVIHGDYNPNNLPDENDWVFGVFLDGRDAQQPMVLGLIPTLMAEQIDPEKNGWGVIPEENADLRAKKSTPEEIGQPSNSRLHRGENIEDTYVVAHEMNRVEDIESAEGGPTWSETVPAYKTEYPFNHVWETKHHSIELDDSRGGERITIRHKEGGYIEIDSAGTTTNKSVGDVYEVYDKNHHQVVGGKQKNSFSTITINGNAYVRVNGNKTEEITGDYQQIVHGNAIMSVGGQLTFNATEQVQLRAADLKLEANVGTMAIKAAKEMQIQSGVGLNLKSKLMWQQATDTLNIKGDNTFIEGTTQLHQKSGKLYVDSDGLINVYSGGATTIHSSGGNLSLRGKDWVYADPKVSMANGSAVSLTAETRAQLSPDVNEVVTDPVDAAVVEAPEPAAKITSVETKEAQSTGSSGYTAQDDDSQGAATGTKRDGQTIAGFDPNNLPDSDSLIELIIEFEGYSPVAFWDVSQWTVGYGSYAGSRERTVPPTIPSVANEEAAVTLLRKQIVDYQADVELANRKGGFDWNENQINALTSFHYNTGSINTIIHQDGNKNKPYRDVREVGEALLLYNKVRAGPLDNNGQPSLIPIRGLTNRRVKEKALYDKPIGFSI